MSGEGQGLGSPQQTSAALAAGPEDVSGPALTVAACSDVGRKRTTNEDSFLIFDLGCRATYPPDVEIVTEIDAPGVLLAVADGMGGHRSGEIASQLCIDAMSREFDRMMDLSAANAQVDWEKALVDAVESAHQSVAQAARENPENYGMGTTLTAVLLSKQEVTVAQVGDSRAYLFRQGVLTQLTRDQTIANSLAELNREMPADKRIGEMLVQAIGAVERVDVEIRKAVIEPEDQLLVCSDGLYKMLEPADITAVLRSCGSLLSRANRLIACANAAGGADNITVLLAEVGQHAA